MKKLVLSGTIIFAFVIFCLYHTATAKSTLPLNSQKKLSMITYTSTPVPTTIISTPSQSSQDASPTPTDTPTTTSTPTSTSRYKDGSYTGDAADAIYGNIQVKATIKNGKITAVNFLQAPNDRNTSVYINSQADPMLAQEAIQAQSANVDVVSGATDSSQAFIQSLQSALDKSKN